MYFCLRSGLVSGAECVDELLNLSWLNVQSGSVFFHVRAQSLKLLHLWLLKSLLLCFFVQIWFITGFLSWVLVFSFIRSTVAVMIAFVSIEIRFPTKSKLLSWNWNITPFASFLRSSHLPNSHLVLYLLLINYLMMKLNFVFNLIISKHSFMP